MAAAGRREGELGVRRGETVAVGRSGAGTAGCAICMALRGWLPAGWAEYRRQVLSCGEAACSCPCVGGAVMGTTGLAAEVALL